MSYANYKCTLRYGIAIGVDKFGREGDASVFDNAVSVHEGRTVAICPNELTARKVRDALEAHDGRAWVVASNAALDAREGNKGKNENGKP